MLSLKRLPPLKEILAYRESLSAERRYEVDTILRPLVIWQDMPDLALIALSGIFLPPHQRIILYALHLGATQNVVIGSRGTSKSSVVDVLYASYRALLWQNRTGILLSASGFRGGQMLYNDLEKWASGGWVDQDSTLNFLRNAIKNDKIVHRAQNFWQVEFKSFSKLMTVPTNDPSKLRGLRGTELYVDEANFTDFELIDKVAESFLNVLQDFATGGENAAANCVYYTSTIDYGWRDFQRTVRGSYDGLQRELEALALQRRGDWTSFKRLEEKGLHDVMYVNFDYTDTIMRRYITNRRGKRFEVVWPDKTRGWRHDPQGIPFTKMGENGRMQREGEPCEIITTYPINRKMEGKLLRGETSEEIFLAEQRNVEDSSAGDVYAHALVDYAVCKGGRSLIAWQDAGERYQRIHRRRDGEEGRPYVPGVMYTCTDPCVLGIDYAPGSRDFCALVVIRIGPLAEGEFDPITGLGKTRWSNVIWAEQHRNSTGENIAEKIREFAERYNLHWVHDPYETDTWKLCRAIGLDGRGGGQTVREALVFINHAEVPKSPDGKPQYRIYDPLDKDERLVGFKTDADAKAMLDVIMPTAPLNDKLVEFTVGQLQQHLLYLPADTPASERPMDQKIDIAYDGARILEHQLRALQSEVGGSGYRRFFVPGDEELVGNKKDMWAAFIYAAKQLRAHLLRAQLVQNTPPPTGGVVTKMLGKQGVGRFAAGAKRM